MRYGETVRGKFIARPNRFIAQVELGSECVTVHVKNTGRCRELLVPGAEVILAFSDNPARKTAYDLIAVYKGNQLINIDSQCPNKVAAEYIPQLFPDAVLIKPEVTHGDSRFDFYIETPNEKIFLEVKGVTLENDGIARFPDAPTQRGSKHLCGLANCLSEGYSAYVLFVIQMKGISALKPNDTTDPVFSENLRKAALKGVKVCAVDCIVKENEVHADLPVKVIL